MTVNLSELLKSEKKALDEQAKREAAEEEALHKTKKIRAFISRGKTRGIGRA